MSLMISPFYCLMNDHQTSQEFSVISSKFEDYNSLYWLHNNRQP
jgi:hypothetical protein